MLLLTPQGVHHLAMASLGSALYDRSGERHAAALAQHAQRCRDAAPAAALAAQAAISGQPILALPEREDAALAAARPKQGKDLVHRLAPASPIALAAAGISRLALALAQPESLRAQALVHSAALSTSALWQHRSDSAMSWPRALDGAPLIPGYGVEMNMQRDSGEVYLAYGFVVAPHDHHGALRAQQQRALEEAAGSKVAIQYCLAVGDRQPPHAPSRQSGVLLDGIEYLALAHDYYDVIEVDVIRRAGASLLQTAPAVAIKAEWSMFVRPAPSFLPQQGNQSGNYGAGLTEAALQIALGDAAPAPADTALTAVFRHLLAQHLQEPLLLELVDSDSGQTALPPGPCSRCASVAPLGGSPTPQLAWRRAGRCDDVRHIITHDRGVVAFVAQRYQCGTCRTVFEAGGGDFWGLAKQWPTLSAVQLSLPHMVLMGTVRLTEQAADMVWAMYSSMPQPRVAPLVSQLVQRLMSCVEPLSCPRTKRAICRAWQDQCRAGYSQDVLFRALSAALAEWQAQCAAMCARVVERRSLNNVLQIMFEHCVEPRVAQWQKLLVAQTGVIGVDCTFALAKRPFVVDDSGARYLAGTTAVTLTGLDSIPLAPPVLSGNESARTVWQALQPLLEMRRDALVNVHALAARAPVAIAVDNVAAMQRSLQLLLCQVFTTADNTAIVQDVFHAIKRVTASIPNRHVHPDGPAAQRATFDTYMCLTLPCAQQQRAQPPTANGPLVPSDQVLRVQHAWLHSPEQAGILLVAQQVAMAWRRGTSPTSDQADVMRKVILNAGWVLEPATIGSAWPVDLAKTPTPLFGLPVVGGFSSPVAILAHLACSVGLLKPRSGSHVWAARPSYCATVASLPLPANVGPGTTAEGAQRLSALQRAFTAPLRGHRASGSGVPSPNDAGGVALSGIFAASKEAAKALQRAGSGDATTVKGLMASARLCTGPSGTGPNEAYHSLFNTVFNGLGSITVPTYRRVATVLWMRTLARRAAARLWDCAPVDVQRLAPQLRSAAGLACDAMHLIVQGLVNHPLSTGCLWDALHGTSAPRAYTVETALCEGLSLCPTGGQSVNSVQRAAILLALQQVCGLHVDDESDDRPRQSRASLANRVAARCTHPVSVQQVLGVACSTGWWGHLQDDTQAV
jgi:hypothetical protein